MTPLEKRSINQNSPLVKRAKSVIKLKSTNSKSRSISALTIAKNARPDFNNLVNGKSA
jgi:hypothetical protein